MSAQPKMAFVFPGQGSQRVAMGKELRASDPDLYARYFEPADAASELPVRRYVEEGPMEDLTRTDVAQPALFSLSLALAEVAGELGLRPDFVAGHSLGEYTAAVAGGALGADDGVRLVCRRGRAMAAIQSERPGAMAAVIGLPADTLAEACERASQDGKVALANLNSPTQIVVSGEEAGVERVIELAQEAGAQRAVRLVVGAAFHSELMKPVQEELREAMSTLSWKDSWAPLAANHSGELIQGGDQIREALIAQIASPVRWVQCVQSLIDAGSTTFVEVGPGRVLSGLIRQIDPGVETFPADSREKLSDFAAAHPQFVR